MSGFKNFRPWQSGEFVLCFMDTAAGGNDRCAAQFLSHKWLDVAEIYHQQVTCSFATPLIHQRLSAISQETGIQPVVAFERNNGGNFEMDRLARLNRYGAYRIYTMKNTNTSGRMIDTGKYGWDTNMATRPKMLQELKDAIEGKLLHLYHRQTVNELFSFIVNQNGRAEAEEGAHDDLVMSLAGVWQMYQTEAPISDDGGSAVVETIPLGHAHKEAGILIAENYDNYS